MFGLRGVCLFVCFRLTLEGEEDSRKGLREAGDPGGEDAQSQEGERHGGRQRRPGRPLRAAHDRRNQSATSAGADEREKTYSQFAIFHLWNELDQLVPFRLLYKNMPIRS